MHNTGQTGGTPDADLDAPEGWDAEGLGTFPATGGVKIGIIDTGIDQMHPELSGNTADCTTAIGGPLTSGQCPDVEVAAPGEAVLSTIPGGQYFRLSGTSMATPHASGVAGVLWQLFPADTADLCKAAGGGC